MKLDSDSMLTLGLVSDDVLVLDQHFLVSHKLIFLNTQLNYQLILYQLFYKPFVSSFKRINICMNIDIK